MIKKESCFAWSAVIFLLAIFIFGISTYAENRPEIEGTWQGLIETPGMNLDIIVEFQKVNDSLTGDIDIPVQKIKDWALINISYDGDSAKFEMPDIPGDPGFAGIISPDGDSLYGDFVQSGLTMKFYLARFDEEARAEKAAKINEALSEIRNYIDTSLAMWNTPGISVAIVMNDSVLMAEGFGYRNLEDSLPVTSKTLFAIGSCTKAFTTAAMGILVDEGKLDWEAKVTEYLPAFQLHDDYATDHMNLIDLVTHRSGLPRHDALWYGTSLTRKELFNRLKFLEFSEEFRTEFQYNNLMFMTAGLLIGNVAGTTWEDFVKKKILDPLKMTNSNFSVNVSQQADDYALPYIEKKDSITLTDFRNIDAMGPAGSINSSAEDMAKWLKFQLNGGKVNGNEIVSSTNIDLMHSPQIVMRGTTANPEILFSAYGLGWGMESYRGHYLVQHGGGIDGFTAMVTLLPQDDIGIVVLANKSGDMLTNIVPYMTADLLLELEPADWHGRYTAQRAQMKEMIAGEGISKEMDRVEDTEPSHDLKDYAGEYENPAYGTVKITADKKSLTANYHDDENELEHWHYDVFRTKESVYFDQKVLVTFITNISGDINELKIPLEPTVDPIVFKRKASAKFYKTEYLEKYTGKFELATQMIEFTIKADSILVSNVTGQPPYDLVPVRENEFSLKGMEGFKVEFVVDKKGKVTEAIFKQPNGVFTAKRVE